ncbi:MAG TPA: hypothetical protein VEA38_06905, partial [Terriglobales bacterium]|nr:hypothetical protein [Terriglobales bacterium]
REGIGTAQAEKLRVPLADGTLLPTPGIPSDDLVPHLLAASDVLGTGWFGARRRYLRVSDCGVRTRLDPCRTADYTVGVPRPEPESP